MSAQMVSAGSQPAVDLACDSCGRGTRMFCDSIAQAVKAAAIEYGWRRSLLHRDFCPNCHFGGGPWPEGR